MPSYLSDIERGHKQPSLPLAAKLEAETGIPAREFVREAAQ
jgi:transcriptional regulator with XRE-family HTH domain